MEQRELTADETYSELISYIQENKISKVMLVCDDSLRYLRIYKYLAEIEQASGIHIIYFSDFKPNPLYESVVRGVKWFRRHNCDAIIAIGGGSAIDVAKCIKLYSNMDPEKNYLCQEIIPNGIKLLAVPTTAGTGSESTRFAVIYYNNEKQSIAHDSCLPDAFMLDPSVLKSLPTYQKKSAALDALCHAIESFWSVNSTEESMRYSEESIKMIRKNLEGYLANEEKCNNPILRAAHLAGKAINITETTAGHAMCYKLTSLYGIAHGHGAALCVGKLWPFMIEHIDRCTDPRGGKHLLEVFLKIARAMGCASVTEAAEKFQKILRDMELSVPVLRDDDMGILTKSVNPVRLKNNPVSLTIEMIEYLYRQILEEGNFVI